MTITGIEQGHLNQTTGHILSPNRQVTSVKRPEEEGKDSSSSGKSAGHPFGPDRVEISEEARRLQAASSHNQPNQLPPSPFDKA